MFCDHCADLQVFVLTLLCGDSRLPSRRCRVSDGRMLAVRLAGRSVHLARTVEKTPDPGELVGHRARSQEVVDVRRAKGGKRHHLLGLLKVSRCSDISFGVFVNGPWLWPPAGLWPPLKLA